MPKGRVSISLDQTYIDYARQRALEDGRTLSNYLELVLKDALLRVDQARQAARAQEE